MDELKEFEEYLQEMEEFFNDGGYRYVRQPRYEKTRESLESQGKNPGERIVIYGPDGNYVFWASYGYDTLGKLNIRSFVGKKRHTYCHALKAAEMFYNMVWESQHSGAFASAI